MKHWDTEIFEFGEKDNKIVHVTKVKNGLKSECVCPYCKEKLIAANKIKSKNLRPHFRHYSKINCDFKLYQETVIHSTAKDIIQEQGFISLPLIKYSYSRYLKNFITSIDPDENFDINNPPEYINVNYKESKIKFEEIKVEQKVRQIKPDIQLTVNKKPLVVEIAYTHFCEDEKLKKIQTNKTNAVEIDLSGLSRNSSKAKISEALNKTCNIKWLFNEKKLLFLKEMVKNAAELRDYIFDKALRITAYGDLSFIYKCPLKKLKDNEYIYVEKECDYCKYLVDKRRITNYSKEFFEIEKKYLEEKGENIDILYKKYGKKIEYKLGEIVCGANLIKVLEKIYNG